MREEYKTRQKKLIIEYLEKNKNKFVSVAEIYDAVKEKCDKIGQVTVYRFINKLEENNELRIETKNNTKYVQLIMDECSNHYHLKCSKCGKIIHLECEDFDKINKHIFKDHDFIIDNNTMIYGRCKKCCKKK